MRKLVIEEFSRIFPTFLGLVNSLDGEKDGEEFFLLSTKVELSEGEESIPEFWEIKGSESFFRLDLGDFCLDEIASELDF